MKLLINQKIVKFILMISLVNVALSTSIHAFASENNHSQLKPKIHFSETETIRIRPGKLPYISLTADVFYRILASEIAAQRGLINTAANTTLNLAHQTGDPRLAHRSLEFFLAQKDLKGALEAVRLWTILAPTDVVAASTELVLAAANGETKGLTEALRRRIQASHDKNEAIAQAFVVISRLENRQVALQILDQTLSSVPKSVAAHLALADAAQAAGNFIRAAHEARVALKIDPKSEAAIQRILEYGIKQDRARTLSQVHTFLTHHPQAHKLRLRLAIQLGKEGDYEAASAELDTLSKNTPENFDLLLLQAQLAYKLGNLNQARSLIEHYLYIQNQRKHELAADSTNAIVAQAYVLLAQIAEDQIHYDEAINYWRQIDDPSMHYSSQLHQANLYAKQGNLKLAFKKLDALEPKAAEERLLLVLARTQILRQSEHIDQAIKELLAANKAMPNTTEIQYELAMLYEKQGNFDEMERLLRQIIITSTNYAHAYNALGYSLADRSKCLTEAQDLINHALQLSPDDPYILDSMGWLKYRMNDFVQAIQWLERAYKQRPEAEIAAHLIEVLWRQGNRDQAQRILKENTQKSPDNKTLNEVVKRLEIKL